MSVQFLAQQSQAEGSGEREWLTVGKTVFWAFYDGAGNIKVQMSTDQAKAFGAAVTVDSTAGDNDVMLNDPLAWDPVTSRLHLLYGRNVTNGGSPPVLCHRYSDDQGATWSAEHVIDNGGARGNNRFYRVGITAYNGHVSIWYASISFSTFTTDGSLWLARSSDGGATWGAGAAQYGGSVVMPTEPNVAQDGQYAIATWYDPGVVANLTGPLYCSLTKDGGATWSAAPVLINAGPAGGYGRPRPAIKNGTIIVAAQGWDAQSGAGGHSDLETIRSTDMGATWAAPVQRIGYSNVSGRTVSHPDVRIVGDHVFLLWNDLASTPNTYGLLESDDDGATFGAVVVPLTTTGNTDAPKLLDTDDYLISLGNDSTAGNTIWSRLPIFAAQPGSVDLLDSFNRADEDPLSQGGNWTTGVQTATPLKIVTNAVEREQASGTFRRDGSRYTARSLAANAPQGAKITAAQISTVAAGQVAALYLWNNPGNGYCVDMPSNVPMILQKMAAGVTTTIFSSTFTAQAGDQVELQIDGNDIIAWLTRAGSVYELARVSDTAVRMVFSGALESAATTDPTRYRLDDFGHAQLTAPVNTVAPTIAGAVAVGQTLSVSSNGTWATANGATPQRWAYQWQTSPDGITWTNVAAATLAFFTVADGTKQHRCVVTATNTIGATGVASNAMAAPAALVSSGFFAAA